MSIDRFPLELIYELFSYFSCDEILRSFYSLNRYFNSIIENYQFYFLDFSSDRIRKREFDLICSLIHPSQIIGLKLGKTRFNLMENYVNSIDVKSFSHLRSLWLNETILFNEISSQWISSNQLRSFRFDAIDKFLFIKQLNSTWENLSHLVGCSSEFFRRLNNQIPNRLMFLHMFFNSIDDLVCLLDVNAQQLKSLGVGMKCNSNDIDRFSLVFKNYQWKKLIQFNLNLQGLAINDVQWTNIKAILSPMSQLRYLTLIFSEQNSIDYRLFNGNEWKSFISISLPFLKRFSFKLPFGEEHEVLIKTCLDTFQTSWWINIKQWCIEYLSEENALITVPDYSPKIFTFSSFDRHSKFYYLNIRELKFNLSEFNQLNNIDRSYLIHVKHLSLNGILTKEQSDRIRRLINIDQIEHFQMISTDDHFHEYVQLIVDMSYLSSLDIQCLHSRRLFRQFSSPLFGIRRLVFLGSEMKTMDLYYLFPNLIELTSEYQSRRILSDLLNHLFRIEQINFRLTQHNHVPNHRWIAEHTRLNSHSFQSDIFNLNYKERLFVIWINQDQNINQRHKHHKCPIQ